MTPPFQFSLRDLLVLTTLASIVTAFLVMGYGQAAFAVVCGMTIGRQSGSLGFGVAVSLAALCVLCGVGFVVPLLLGTGP